MRKSIFSKGSEGSAITMRNQICMLSMFASISVGIAVAQDAEDYKGALAMAKRDGCTTASIPYPDLRDTAERKQADVTRWCKEAPRSCTGLETKKLRATIDGIPKDIESLGKVLDNLRSNRSSASESERSSIDDKIKDTEKKLDERKKDLEYSKKSLETDISDAEKRIYNGNQCVDARKEVQPSFRTAASRAKDAGRNDSNLKPMTDELVNIWESCERDHEKDVNAAKDQVEYCKKAKDGDL